MRKKMPEKADREAETDDLEQFIVDRDSESPGFAEKVESAEDAALERRESRGCIALYVRTSTKDQDGEAQLYELRAAAAQRGWTDVAEFVDIGHSGAKASRPALDDLRKEARFGRIDTVMIASFDRLGRSLFDLLALLDELSAAGCAVVSLREPVDLGTPAGRFQVQIIGAAAEFEREMLRERVQVGIERAKAEGTKSGKTIGRPKRIVCIEAVRKAIAEHGSVSAASRALEIPRATVQRALKGAQKAPDKQTPLLTK